MSDQFKGAGHKDLSKIQRLALFGTADKNKRGVTDAGSFADGLQAMKEGNIKVVGAYKPGTKLYQAADEKSPVLKNLVLGKTLDTQGKFGMGWYHVKSDGLTGWVKAEDVSPIKVEYKGTKIAERFLKEVGGYPNISVSQKAQSNSITDLLMNELESMKQKYEQNLFIKVTGFSVTLGVPPSVSVSFEFRK